MAVLALPARRAEALDADLRVVPFDFSDHFKAEVTLQRWSPPVEMYVDWGDGDQYRGTIQPNAPSPFFAAHSYNVIQQTSVTVSVKLRDAAGETWERSRSIIVVPDPKRPRR